MNELRTINIHLQVYVPANLNEDEVEDYLNNKLYDEPEFFGYIDQGCFTYTDQLEDQWETIS